MSLKIGGSASKTKTTSNTTTNSTRTPIVPEWASNLTQGVAGRVGGLLDIDAQSTVAPLQGLQNQAAAGAQNLSGQTWNYEGGIDLTRGVANTGWLDRYMRAPGPSVQSESLLSNLNAYMSPYTKDVVDTALADYDFGAGQTRAQQDLELAGSGAFGGSGSALTRSMTEDAILRGRATTSANLRDQAFQRGTALSNQDADRRQQANSLNAQLQLQDWNQRVGQYMAGQDQRLRAGAQLAGLAGDFEANQRANIATQAQVGDALRNVDQQQRQAPFTTTQQIVAALNGLPIGLFTGEQTDSTQKTKGKSTTIGVEFSAEKPA